MINQLIKISYQSINQNQKDEMSLPLDKWYWNLSPLYRVQKRPWQKIISTWDELNIFHIIQVPLEAFITKKQTSSELQV